MSNHLEIFEDIYDIKDNITDGQFLNLNNKARKLVQEIKDLRQSLSKYVIEEVCCCSTRYIFPDMFNLIENNISDFFCIQSYERIVNCENFKRLMEKFPHLENIFQRINLPFADEPIYQEYVKDEINISANNDILFRNVCENGSLEIAEWLIQLKPDIYSIEVTDRIITPTIMKPLYVIGTVQKSETIICSICLEINSEIETQCKHLFCKKCIAKWININKMSCPICRQSM